MKTYIDKVSSPLLDNIQIAREAPRYLYAASRGRRLHLVLILTKYLLTNSSFVLKVRTPFDPDNSVISLRLPNRNTMNLPDGAPTHQFIGYDPSSSAWSLAYHLHTQNGLHD